MDKKSLQLLISWILLWIIGMFINMWEFLIFIAAILLLLFLPISIIDGYLSQKPNYIRNKKILKIVTFSILGLILIWIVWFFIISILIMSNY